MVTSFRDDTMKNIFKEIFNLPKLFLSVDPSAKSQIEVVLLHAGFRAIVCYRFYHELWKLEFFFWARFFSELNKFFNGVEIHPGAKIGKNFVIDHGQGIVIGETAILEDNVMLFHGVTLGSRKVADPVKMVPRHPHVGSGVIIGANSVILGPVHIGHHSRIAAQSLVLDSVPSYSFAKPLKSSVTPIDTSRICYADTGLVAPEHRPTPVRAAHVNK